LSVFAPYVFLFPPIAPFVLFAPLPLKTAHKGTIPLTLRTTGLAQFTDVEVCTGETFQSKCMSRFSVYLLSLHIFTTCGCIYVNAPLQSWTSKFLANNRL